MEEKLIELVKDQPILYDLKNKGYKNFIIKDKIWKNIAGELDTNVELCKKKWKGLRDQYRRNKQKNLMPSGSGASGVSTKWKYFDNLTFLDNFNVSRETIETTELTNDTDYGAYDFSHDDSFLNEAYDWSGETNNCDKTEEPKPKIKKRNVVNDGMLKFLDSASKSINEITKKDDENCSSTKKFMMALADRIDEANLPLKEKLTIEKQISDLVYTALI